MFVNSLYHCYLNIRSRARAERRYFTAPGALLIAFAHEYNRIARRRGLSLLSAPLPLRVRGSAIKLHLRIETSDYRVFLQIFVEREYAPLEDIISVRTVVDCGANTGYSSLYFLNRFPRARVIAIEPDPANALICERNLKPYGKRAIVINGAIWPQKQRLAVVRGSYRDGEAWATQVRPMMNPSEKILTAEGIDMPRVLDLLKGEAIDLLKIDIERSELELFASHTEWLNRVRNVAIELHDEECREVFLKALQKFTFRLGQSGELTIARDIEARSLTCNQLS